MADFKASFKQLGKGFRLPVSGSHVVTVVPNPVPRIRLVGMFFDLNKCFLRPEAIPGIQQIKSVYDQHPGGNLLAVGHTDTSGADDFNLTLSLERADAVAAFLTDQTAAWESFFGEDKPAGKRWGTLEVQLMLSALPDGSPPNQRFFQGQADGKNNPATIAAVKAFQKKQNLKDDGIAGKDTQHALVTSYMAIDKTSLPAGITLTTHGCGENFPVSGSADGKRNTEDRRVEIFVFDGPITPQPPANTSKRGSQEYPQWLSQVSETIDFTFAPAGALATFTMQLLNARREPMKSIEYTLHVNGLEFKDTTDDAGFLSQQIDAAATTGKITVGATSMDLVFEDLDPPNTPLGAQQRLSNLGFADIDRANGQSDPEFGELLASFQESEGIPVTGALDSNTENGLTTAVA